MKLDSINVYLSDDEISMIASSLQIHIDSITQKHKDSTYAQDLEKLKKLFEKFTLMEDA
jgi:hypothetical protein